MTCREVQSKCQSKNKLTQQTQMYSSKFVFPNGLGGAWEAYCELGICDKICATNAIAYAGLKRMKTSLVFISTFPQSSSKSCS